MRGKRMFRWFLMGIFLLLIQVFVRPGTAQAATTGQTLILGQSQVSAAQMITYLQQNNPSLSFAYDNSFVSTTISEANTEGIRPDVAFALMMHETGFLNFGGTVQASQNNFGGIGVTGQPGVQGSSFPSMQIGIRAVIQHLQAYATTSASLHLACVDPRYQYVQRGTAPYVEWLGIPDNPYGTGWAAQQGYGNYIVNQLNYMKTINPQFMNVNLPGYQGLIDHTTAISGWVLDGAGLQSAVVKKSDGTVLGQVSSFSSVPSSSSTFPGYNGSLYGFSIPVDTTALPNGSNTLTIVATGKDGHIFTLEQPVTVNNLPMILNVDSPANGAAVNNNLSVYGWGLNVSGLKSVSVEKYDGTLLAPVITNFTARPDVAAAFPGYLGNSDGFLTFINTAQLPNGPQKIKVVVVGNNGENLTQIININVNNLPMLVNIDGPVSGQTHTGNVAIFGWALNISGMKSVTVQNSAGTALGVFTSFSGRPDVAKVFPGYPGDDSGFLLNLLLPNGSQTLILTFVGNNGETIVRTITLNIDNTPKTWVDRPADGGTVQGTITVSGWALNVSGLKSVAIEQTNGSLLAPVITNFSPRGDVASVFPGFPVNSGFSANLDTTALPNGLQTVLVVATGNDGSQNIRQIHLNVNNLPMIVDVDSPQTSVTQAGYVNFLGWAVSTFGMKSVTIKTAGGSVLGVVNIFTQRPDVAKVFPGYQNYSCGFYFNLTQPLPSGTQNLQLVFTDNRGNTITKNITLSIDNSAKICVDNPGSGASVTGRVDVFGWALQISGLQSVQVQASNGTVLASQVSGFIARPDVARVFPGYSGLNDGFSLIIDTSNLPNGPQTLQITVTGVDGNKIVVTRTINVNNPPMRVNIDGPRSGGTSGGLLSFFGWAVNISGMKSIVVEQGDGTVLDTITSFAGRPDVAAVYPGYPSYDGFSFTVAKPYANGAQTFKLIFTAQNGQTVTQNVTVNIDNTPKIYIDRPGNIGFVQSGSLAISGWALNLSGVKEIDISGPSGLLAVIPAANFSARPDVNNVFPGFLNGTQSGFSYTLTGLGSATQVITVTAVGNDGTSTQTRITVNPPHYTVVIDPGHGGSDPGASYYGVNEKDITLAVALKLKQILNSNGINVVLTRTTDTYVSLDQRANISNSSGGQIFISLHCNAVVDSGGNPVTGVAGVLGTYYNPNQISPDINSQYPGTPQAQANAALSQDLATRVANGVASATGQQVIGYEAHAYQVLRTNNLPSTLVEMGFLTNPATAAAMQTGSWQQNAANGVANGILAYFAAHP